MKAKIEHPRIKVLLHKTVRRSTVADGAPASGRFTQMPRLIDLTPFIGEGGYVRTQKGVREPGGGFQLVLPDKPKPGEHVENGLRTGSYESLYGLIEPMDVVEIRMGREPGSIERLPLIMRGFVSNVSRSEAMDQSGRAVRQVNVSGQDYGKLWQQLQINYLPGYITGEDIVSAFQLYEKYGVGFQTGSPGYTLMEETVDKILNPYLGAMLPGDSRLPRKIQVDTSQRIRGSASIAGMQTFNGSVYQLMATFLDVGPFNELFLEDREDGVWCVLRPNPFKHLGSGQMIVPGAIPPEVVEILDDDVQSMQLERADDQVANYFWVRGPRFENINDPVLRAGASQNATSSSLNLTGYQNTSEQLYGIKTMEVATNMGADGETSFTSGLPEAETQARAGRVSSWLDERREQLVAQNKDNVVLESGLLRIKGTHRVRAGTYLRVKRGDFSAEYYVHRVQQDFMPYQGWLTNVFVDRGTGFAKRAARGGGADSPYLAELRK